jgi:hypothetical protein
MCLILHSLAEQIQFGLLLFVQRCSKIVQCLKYLHYALSMPVSALVLWRALSMQPPVEFCSYKSSVFNICLCHILFYCDTNTHVRARAHTHTHKAAFFLFLPGNFFRCFGSPFSMAGVILDVTDFFFFGATHCEVLP